MIGQTFSHYTILDKLGEGGMGEVYRANDDKLGREVAIKVLPEAFVADQGRLSRFEREARLLAALDHRNIASIYGLEEADGKRLLVMQIAEGENLQERISRGPVPVNEVMKIGLQISEALEAAHAKGIIHRDLKPANVVVDGQGQVKVLDFGLAKALESDPSDMSAHSLAASPTLTAQMTEAGMLLGTAAYMSPEQARGEPADKRADLWALGVVLWEMLTGSRLFIGRTVSDTLAGVLRDEPQFEALPTNTPPSLRRLLRRCLEREPRERLPDAASARLELEDALAGRSDSQELLDEAPRTSPSPAWLRVLPWALFALAAVWAVGQYLWPPPVRRTIRLEASLSSDEPLYLGRGSSVVLSPDGSRLAYVTDSEVYYSLYLRSLDQLDATLLAGGPPDQFAFHPFFSPDGQWIGFFSADELKKIPVSGGTPITLCQVKFGRGGSWGPSGTIAFSAAGESGLFTVSSAGGNPQPLTTLDEESQEYYHRWPDFLPSGKAVLFTVGKQAGMDSQPRVELVSLDTGQRRILVENAYHGRYLPTGDLVFIRDQTLFAVPFDTETLEVTGDLTPLVQDITSNLAAGAAQYSFSNDGTLVYVTGQAELSEYSVVWVDRNGQASRLWDAEASYAGQVISPDGKSLAVAILRDDNWDLWIYDLERDVATRLTFDDAYDADAVWSQDGQFIYFASGRNGTETLYRKRADGSGEVELIGEGDVNFYPSSITPDGRIMLGMTLTDTVDIYFVTLDEDRTPQPFLATSFSEEDAVFSPDGRWVAYASNESGSHEVYIRPYPAAGGKWQISDGGGRWPQWSGDGQQLFYRTNEGISSATVEVSGDTLRVGSARTVFEAPYLGGLFGINVSGYIFHDYTVTADGQRFVMLQGDQKDQVKDHVRIVLNWFDELERTLQ